MSDSNHESRSNNADDEGDARYIIDEIEGLQLHFGRNTFQASLAVLFALIGAIYAWHLTDDRPDLAALCGAVVGAIAGTFVSGFVLMFLPLRKALTVEGVRDYYFQCRRRFNVSLWSSLVLLAGLPLVWDRVGRINHWVAVTVCVSWGCAAFGLLMYTRILVMRLRDWRCPQCGKAFESLWSTGCRCGLPATNPHQSETALSGNDKGATASSGAKAVAN